MDFVKENCVNLLYKKISKIPLNQIHVNYIPPKGKTHAIVSEDSNQIFTYCSKDYNPVLNENIFKPFEKFLNDNKIDYLVQPHIINSCKFYVDYFIKQKIASPKIKNIIPVISLWNSYDGTLSPQINLGFFRLCFKNKLCYKSESFTSCNKLTENIKHFLLDSKKCIHQFELMQDKTGCVKDLDSINIILKLSRKVKDMVISQFKKEIKGNFTFIDEFGEEMVSPPLQTITAFTIYNSINYSIYNLNLKELPEVKLKKNKMIVNEIVKKYIL